MSARESYSENLRVEMLDFIDITGLSHNENRFDCFYFYGPSLKEILDGYTELTGRPILDEIVEKLTKPLTAEETKTGEIKRSRGPETFTGTADELQQLFLQNQQ